MSGGATLLALLVGVPAGYGIARLGAHKAATVLILIARMTPALSYLIPLFRVPVLGLNDTLTALVITHLVDHSADRRLHHGRLFRDAADGARGGRA